MISEVLAIFNDEMDALGIDYHYLNNDKPKITYPYATGEYYETGFYSENQMTNAEILLELWNRGSMSSLILLQEKLKAHFDEWQKVKDGVAVCINYLSGSPERTNDVELKKVRVTLEVVYWKGK